MNVIVDGAGTSMSDDFFDLPREVREGLAGLVAEAPSGAVAQGLRVRAGDAWHPVRRIDAAGFELAGDAARLPGHVEIWEGGRMVRAALVVAARGAGRRYEFKRTTPARRDAPLDYVPFAPEPPARAGGEPTTVA